MAVNYKIGADASSFKQGVNEAQASLKTLDAALKVNEASFRAGGNAQIYMEQRTKLLSDKMKQQKDLVTQLQQGLQQMRTQGISPTSVEYQKLETRMLNAQTAMLETKSAIDGLDASQMKAAGSAGTLAENVNSIGKKINLDQVISGISTITGGLENVGRKAAEIGEKIWNTIMDTARWADDTGTQALMYGVDVETFQKQMKVFDSMADMSVDAYYKARTKMQNAVNNPSDEQMSIFSALGIQLGEWKGGGKFGPQWQKREWESVFWEFGRSLNDAVSSGRISKDLADVYSNAIFGKNFMSLNPLFAMGEEGFKTAVQQQTAAAEQTIENNAALADSVTLLQENWMTFKQEVLGGIAPSLTGVSDSISDLINSFTAYAQSEDGQALLTQMGETVKELFKDMTDIKPDEALKSFQGIFNGLKDGLEWITNNSGSVVSALKDIVTGWGTLTLTGAGMQIYKIITGLQDSEGLNKAMNKIFSQGTTPTPIYDNPAGPQPVAAQPTVPTGGFGGISIGGTIGGVALGDYLDEFIAMRHMSKEELNQYWTEKLGLEPGVLQIPAEPTVPENAAEEISKVIGPVTVPVNFSVGGGGLAGSGGGGYTWIMDKFQFHANGIWSVPFDGYPAILHRGERVIPANQVNRNFNSNTYFDKVNIYNGSDADAIAKSIAAANRRMAQGYGN